MQISEEKIFERQILLIGKEKHKKIQNTKIAIFGIGGVRKCCI